MIFTEISCKKQAETVNFYRRGKTFLKTVLQKRVCLTGFLEKKRLKR
jgi:hypothetical protein